MKHLNYQTLQDLNYDGYLLNEAPERVLQFGEGNFMRAFVDFFIDKMNELQILIPRLYWYSQFQNSQLRMWEILSMNRKVSTHCIYVVPKTDRKSLPNG